MLAASFLFALALGLGGAAPADGANRLLVCQDNLDNDVDGKADWPYDPGCASSTDTTEADPAPVPQCSNGVNNDPPATGPPDGTDFPLDPGCESAADTTEGANPTTQCSDGVNNDAPGSGPDGIDFPADPGCIAASDNSEIDRACSNRGDDDADNKIDFPLDLGCSAPVRVANPPGPNQPDDNENDPPQCDDGRDNDLDGTVDFAPAGNPPDPDCTAPGDTAEAVALVPAQCVDGVDNDGDGRIDFPADAGCSATADNDETDVAAPTQPSSIPAVPVAAPPRTPQGRSPTPTMTPFPVVRLRGIVERRGVRLSLLTVRAPPASKVSVYCSGSSCPRKLVVIAAGRRIVRIRRFERRLLRAGTILRIYVTKRGFVGKYTRFRVMTGSQPARTDSCARVAGAKPLECPVS